MDKGKAFVIIGHSDWGKSRTLQKLTHSNHKGWFEINGKWFFIKRMSNDDIAVGLKNFLTKCNPKTKKYLIITLCPDFNDPEKETVAILDILKSKYIPYFFILKKQFIGEGEILDDEIARLDSIGLVEILNDRVEHNARANIFKRFVEKNI